MERLPREEMAEEVVMVLESSFKVLESFFKHQSRT